MNQKKINEITLDVLVKTADKCIKDNKKRDNCWIKGIEYKFCKYQIPYYTFLRDHYYICGLEKYNKNG